MTRSSLEGVPYPLTVTFKILALSPELTLHDASGRLLMVVKEKLLSLREGTTVYADLDKRVPLYRFRADRVLNLRAVRHITRADTGEAVGAVRAQGLRTLWGARYEVTDARGDVVMHVREDNPWIKVIDGLVDEIPIVGPIVGMFINPTYTMSDVEGRAARRIVKKRSFVERRFTMESAGPLPAGASEELAALALVQVVLLERDRG
ncbi:hypothetical protein [Deinococcus pimensis]|uniref:hypothetical protein n=1 Tax=Deinococcus pimensis TaxID=309888 RepID=UPI0004AD7794|nr:hypothetical protein [Deinococcus pimensis]